MPKKPTTNPMVLGSKISFGKSVRTFMKINKIKIQRLIPTPFRAHLYRQLIP